VLGRSLSRLAAAERSLRRTPPRRRARPRLRFGAWTFDFEDQPASMIRESLEELEELGWQAFWCPGRNKRHAVG
jgi:hypothetical protein